MPFLLRIATGNVFQDTIAAGRAEVTSSRPIDFDGFESTFSEPTAVGRPFACLNMRWPLLGSMQDDAYPMHTIPMASI